MPQRRAKKPIGRPLLLEQLEPRRPLAVDFQLVADLLPGGYEEQNLIQSEFVECNGLVYFRAGQQYGVELWRNGLELWRSDGTPEGTFQVLDLNPNSGALADKVFSMANVNGTLYFSANDGAAGVELWKTDGTAAGTSMVKDIWPGYKGSAVSGLFNDNGRLYFVADNGASGLESWTSDGTEAGTYLLKDIYLQIPTNGSAPQNFTTVGNTQFFTAIDGLGDRRLFKSDGTAAGTVEVVAPNNQRLLLPSTAAVAVRGNELFFIRNDGPSGTKEIWKTDGSVDGTVLVRSFDSFYTPSQLVEVNGAVHFAMSSHSGSGLWKTDGTYAGTVRVYEGMPEALNGKLEMVNVGGILYFQRDAELWKSDGTSAGTALIKSWAPYGPTNLTNFGGTLYFSARDASGIELWKSDGSESGTVQVIDLAAGEASASPAIFHVANGRLFFKAQTTTPTFDLWSTDGTAAGTQRLAMLNAPYSSSPTNLANVNGALLFVANLSHNRRSLWRANDTGVGATLIKTIDVPASEPFVPLGNHVYFRAYEYETQAPGLWKSDGWNISRVFSLGASPFSAFTPFVAMSDALYTVGRYANNKAGLWRSDGVSPVPELVAELLGVSSDSPISESIVIVGNRLYFLAQSAVTYKYELWTSDGTAAGTMRLAGNASQLRAVGGDLYFTSSDEIAGRELWKTDGSVVGTSRVKDIWPGTSNSAPSHLTAVGNRLFFVATTEDAGSELWTSDGSAAGTVRVVDINPGTAGSSLPTLAAAGGLLYFTERSSAFGTELWRSDGTAAGTFRVKDVFPGPASASPQSLTEIDGQLYFVAQDGAHGAELWKSNGTAAGTLLVADVAPGFLPSLPGSLTKVDGKLFIAATTPEHGRELWFAQIDPLPTGDYTGDEHVDGADFLAWQRAFGASAIPAGSGADGDASGHVDADDLVVWQEHFGTPTAAVTLAAFASIALEADEQASDHRPSTVTRASTPDWFLIDDMFAQPTVAPTLPSALLREQRALRLATKSARGENNETPLTPRAQSFRLSKNISPAAHDAESDATEEGFDAETLQAGSLRRVRGQQRP